MQDEKIKPTVYLDTTIPSYLFDKRESLKLHIDATQAWWREERSNFDLWISEETVAEIMAADYPKKTELIQFVSAIPVLASDPQIVDIASIYLDHYLMPEC